MTFLLLTQKRCTCGRTNPMVRILKKNDLVEGRFTFADIDQRECSLPELLQLATLFPFIAPKQNGKGWGSHCFWCHCLIPPWDLSDLTGHPIVGLMHLVDEAGEVLEVGEFDPEDLELIGLERLHGTL